MYPNMDVFMSSNIGLGLERFEQKLLQDCPESLIHNRRRLIYHVRYMVETLITMTESIRLIQNTNHLLSDTDNPVFVNFFEIRNSYLKAVQELAESLTEFGLKDSVTKYIEHYYGVSIGSHILQQVKQKETGLIAFVFEQKSNVTLWLRDGAKIIIPAKDFSEQFVNDYTVLS